MEKIEKIDDTPQKMRSQSPFQKFTENIVWGIMMLVIGSYQLLSGNEWYFQVIGVLVIGLGIRNLYKNYKKRNRDNSLDIS
jgi:CDP-diglyceride synthetase